MSREFYQTHAQDYFNQTIQVDPSSFLLPLVKHLAPGSTVLDVGCGSGRDMLWLTERGFNCTGLERSPDLAALAREHTGLLIIEADFESCDFSRMNMDGLLLIGALVHLPHERFSPALSDILTALKPGGHALITMKQGQGRQELEDGRVFYLWEKEYLFSMFKRSGLIYIDFSVQTSSIRKTDTWISFALRKRVC